MGFNGLMPMLILGPVIFQLGTAAYQTFQRSTRFNWVELPRLNPGTTPLLKKISATGPAAQFINLGDDTIHLEGVIYLQLTGSQLFISFMRLTASLGLPLPLIGCDGSILGLWIIERIDQTNSIFTARGIPRKVEFKLDLKRYYPDISSTIGGAILNNVGLI